MTDPNPQQDYVTLLWDLHNRNVRSSVANGSLRRMIIDSVEPDGKVIVREVGTNDIHDEPYLALASVSPYQTGDNVIVGEVMGRGPESSSTRVVIGKAGTAVPFILTDAKSQSVSDTPTTSNIDPQPFMPVISLAMILPAGMWTVAAEGSVLMSHSVSQASWRMSIDGDVSNTHTLSMVTEERFAAAHRISNVVGGRTITVRVEVRSFTAGTTSTRNPMLGVTATRQ